jgi:hypothetical protein
MLYCGLARNLVSPPRLHPAVFRPNETHRQQDLFGVQSRLPRHTWELLKESLEYAFYEEIFCRIPESLFAELYDDSPATRPNAPVNRLVGALILQHMRDWTFEELIDRITFDVKVRAALGLWTLEEMAFCRATLFNFQKRVREHMGTTGRDIFAYVFDLLSAEQMERFGLKGEIQRCDSTQVGSNIRAFTRIELLVEVVLRMWRVLGEAGQARHAERFDLYVKAKTSGHFLYRLRKSELDATLERLGEFYAWMVEALKADYGDTEIYRIVCRLFAEQFTRVEEKVAVRAGKEIRSDSLQSPDDLDATYREKDGEVFHGFVLHAAETADPENPLQLVTDVVVEPNNRDDSRILHDRLPAMKEKTPDLGELHTDATYASEDNDRLEARLDIAHVQTAIRGHLSPAPIHIERDEAGLYRIRCFADHMVQGEPTPTRFKAAFPASACAGCPFAGSCPGQRMARGGRTHYFTEDHLLRQARHRRLQELPQERRTLRANVEATMRQFNAPLRNGKLRTRGLHAAGRYGFLRAVGINFGRIYRHQRKIASPPRQRAVPRPIATLIPRFATRAGRVLPRFFSLLRSFTRFQRPVQYSAAAFA